MSKARAALITATVAILSAALFLVLCRFVPNGATWCGRLLSPIGYWHLVRLFYCLCRAEYIEFNADKTHKKSGSRPATKTAPENAK